MYKAIIDIDDDRWAKHPFAITIFDEDGNEVERVAYLDEREDCYKISDKYGIDQSDIEEEFY